MNTCPKCGAQFPSTVKICPNDATVLESGAAADPRLGTTLDGKYRLDSALGQGGMGTIYRATHLMLDKPVALKLIKGDLVTSPDVVRRFQREARAASNLNHPNIAAAYDLGQTSDGTLYIAMELVKGRSLKDVIRTTGPIDAARIGRILRQVASALGVAHHHGIIHRDLKPHNIMLTVENGVEVAKLLDFGIAKTFDDSATQLTATGFVLGTPQYMSPEQAAGRPIDGRSDLYSLGVIMWEMLVGEVPFNDPSTPALLVKHLTEPAPVPSRRRPDLAIPTSLEAIALRLLEKDPAARFQSAEEFSAALGAAVGQGGDTATSAASSFSPTVVMPSPSAPTTTAPAPGLQMDPTVIAPPAAPAGAAGQRTGPVASPTVHTQAAPAPAPTAPAPIVAAPAAAAAPLAAAPAPTQPSPAVAPPPMSAASAHAAPTPSGSLGRNGLVVGAVLLLLVALGGYAAYAGWFGGGTPAPASTVANTQPPPAATPPPAAPPAPPAAVESAPAASTNPPPAPSTGSTAGAPSTVASRPAPPVQNSANVSSRGGAAPTSATTEQARGQAGGVVTPPPPPQPANPTVAFRCSGAQPVCGSLRTAMPTAFDAQQISMVNDPGKADILIEARVEVVSERTEQMFGTTFVTRTYSVELSGESRRDSRAVPMPATTTFSFDARVGQEKLDGQSRVIAASAAERVRAFWK